METSIQFAGFYLKMKDRSISLQNRLQLLRFAWKSSEVFIPNKEQVLVDLLFGNLLNRKKNPLSDTELCGVWQCIHDVLKTKKAADPNRIILKMSTAQLLIEAIYSCDSGSDVHLIEAITACCIDILSTATLATVLTSKLDNMVKLLDGLCKVLKLRDTDTGNLQSLIRVAVETFISSLKTAPNQNQIIQLTCGSLIPHIISLWSHEQPSVEVWKLSEAVLEVLCHRDHHHFYEVYLKSRHSPSELPLHKKAKIVEHVFSKFSELMKSDEALKCCSFLPVFYQSFIVHNCHKSNKTMAHFMLMEICSLFGVTRDSPVLNATVAFPAIFRGVNSVLKVVQEHELYSEVEDENNKFAQINFYRHLVEVLLKSLEARNGGDEELYVTCPDGDWYSCLTALLKLNHHIVEPKLKDILTRGWINIKVLQEENKHIFDVFLQQLIVTYNKLRQVPKFVTKLIEILCACQGNQTLVLSPLFLKSYGEIVQSLPQGMMVDIWKLFVTALKSNFIDGEHKGHFQGVCVLFHNYLLNVNVTDYTVTAITMTSIQELLVSMETDILVPLIEKTVTSIEMDIEMTKYTMNLCQSWAEVVLLLAQYRKYRDMHFQRDLTELRVHDLSYLHYYTDRRHWRKFYIHVKASADFGCIYLWNVLSIQTVRAILLFRDISDWSFITAVLSNIMTFPDKFTTEDAEVTWSGQLEDINDTNFYLAKWQLMMFNMHVLHTVLSVGQLKMIAELIVQTVVYKREELAGAQSLYSITSTFLKSPMFRESAGLLSHIITAVWSHCNTCFSHTKSKSPRRKQDSGQSSLLVLLSVLGDDEIHWDLQINSESLLTTTIPEVSKCLTRLMKEAVHCKIDTETLEQLVQLIQLLPLEHFGSLDQIRCLIGLIAVKVIIDQNVGKSKDAISQLSCHCQELCTVILECRGMAPIFQIIEVETYLDWLQRQLEPLLQPDANYYKTLLFMEVSCQAIVRDYHVLVKLQPLTDKLCDQITMNVSDSSLALAMYVLQEVCKLLSLPYINESLKAPCLHVYKTLSEAILKLSLLIHSPKLCQTEAIFVRCCSIIVSTCFKDDNIKSTFLAIFPQLILWCEHVLQDDVATKDLYIVMSALLFLHTTSRYHMILQSVCGQDSKLQIWHLLIAVLKKMLSVNKTKSTNVHNQSDIEKMNQLYSVDQNKQDMLEVTDGKQKKGIKRKFCNVTDTAQCVTDMSPDVLKLENLQKFRKLLSVPDDSRGNSSDSVPKSDFCYNIVTERDDLKGQNNKIHSPAMLNSLVRSLVFGGTLEKEQTRVIVCQAQMTLALLLVSFDTASFKNIIQSLVDDLSTDMLYKDRHTICCSLFVWQHLLHLEFSEEQSKEMRLSAKAIMINFQWILQTLQHTVLEDMVIDIMLPIVTTQQQMLAFGRKFLMARTSVLCLYSCIYTPLEGSTYFTVFHALCNVLDTFLVNHTDTVFQNIPTYIGCAKRLLLSLVQHSNQDKISGHPDLIRESLACAYQMERLFSLISSHKLEFGKVAMYVIADYVTAVQTVTLLPSVKRALVPAIYKMLDICDKHSASQLHVVLSSGVTEVFKLLYNEYTKFHKYSGRV